MQITSDTITGVCVNEGNLRGYFMSNINIGSTQNDAPITRLRKKF